MQKDNHHPKTDDQDQRKELNNPVSSKSNPEGTEQENVVFPSKENDDREKKLDNESGKIDVEKRVKPLKEKSDNEGQDADSITVDENYPGPSESDVQDAEKPGIKGHENVDHGEP